jgi:hypothetical protein
MNTLGHDIERWQKDGFFYIQADGEFVMHPFEKRKLFMCLIDAKDYIKDNKGNGKQYTLRRA